MQIRTNHPGQPWRLRGVPLAPEASAEGGGAGGAAVPASKVADAATKKEAAPSSGTATAEKPAEKPAALAPSTVEKPVEKLADAQKQVQRVDDFDRVLDEKGKAIDAKLAAIDAKYERQRETAVIQTLRKMGADPAIIGDDDLRTLLRSLAPKVDPDTPEGLIELQKIKDTRAGLFRRSDVGPQERLGDYIKGVREDQHLTERQKERKARMASKLLGGDR